MRKRYICLKRKALATAMISVGATVQVPAFGLEAFSEGDLSVNIDTTLSVGAAWRASSINYENVGPYNALKAGEASSHKHGTGVQDNSALRWDKGKTFSEVVKGTIDMQAEYKDFGTFVRGKFFYDDAIVKGDGGNALPAYYPKDIAGNPSEPYQDGGRGGEILDAFVWGNWNLQDTSVNVRLGKQVINWGEGALFANGINTISPIDVNALLTPGAELKEALIPVKMLYSSMGITDKLSMEAFYQFEWEETRAPDCGTFFNTIDLVGENCFGGFYALGREAGMTEELSPDARLDPNRDPFRLARGGDIEPDDGGEFGVAVRYYFEAISSEVGAYYVQYHSRLPIVSGYTPPATSRPNVPFPGGLSSRLTSATYNLYYPEDIKLLGLSFNTNIDLGLPGGETAISGELSYRKDQPFQIEDSVIVTGLVGLPSQLCAETEFNCDLKYPDRQFVDGSVRDDFYQAEVTFIHFFDQTLGADRWTALIDIAYNYANIPEKEALLLNSAFNADLVPAWSAIGPSSPYYGLSSTHEDDYYPTPDSWGYKLRMSGEYSNVFKGINLIPTISFSHDVKGVTPGPVANFLEDRKAMGLSLEANYLNTYKIEVGYTDFYGAEPYNQLNDRDFYSVSASLSF